MVCWHWYTGVKAGTTAAIAVRLGWGWEVVIIGQGRVMAIVVGWGKTEVGYVVGYVASLGEAGAGSGHRDLGCPHFPVRGWGWGSSSPGKGAIDNAGAGGGSQCDRPSEHVGEEKNSSLARCVGHVGIVVVIASYCCGGEMDHAVVVIIMTLQVIKSVHAHQTQNCQIHLLEAQGCVQTKQRGQSCRMCQQTPN